MTELEALKILKDKQQKARQAVRLDRRRLEGCKYCETGSNDFDRREICVNVGNYISCLTPIWSAPSWRAARR